MREAGPERKPAAARPRARDRGAVLVVEDEPAVLRIIVQTLQRKGHRVAKAASGEEALALVGELAELELLVTDVVMPGINGPDLCEQLQRE